jgi:predicted metalloprotease with PDZ domain
VLIARIEEESPAAQAGLRVGDIVTSVDGEEVASAGELRRAIASRDAGDEVTIELYRDGRLEQVTASLGKREPPDFVKRFELLRHVDGEEIAEQVREALEGIDLEDLDADVRRHLESVDWEEIREAVREALDRELSNDQEK